MWKLNLIFFLVHNVNYSQLRIGVEKISQQPYIKHTIHAGTDSSTFYLSESNSNKVLPLIVYIQGSGNFSLFKKTGHKIIPQSGHMTWVDISNNRYRVLIIEKPGVHFLQQDIDNPKYDSLFSLDNWTNLIVSTMELVLQRERIDRMKVMIVGHSEGGIVAAAVAKKASVGISHVSIMAGEGPSQLYSLYRFAESDIFFNNTSETDGSGTDSLLKVWRNILANPFSTRDKFWVFTYLRWSSFLSTSVINELTHYKGNVYIVQGTDDKNVFPESAKILYTALLAQGVNVKLDMIQGVDHSFLKKNNHSSWEDVILKITNWWLVDN